MRAAAGSPPDTRSKAHPGHPEIPMSSSEAMFCVARWIYVQKTVSVSDYLLLMMVRDRGSSGSHSDSSEEEEEEVGGEEIDPDSDQVLGT